MVTVCVILLCDGNQHLNKVCGMLTDLSGASMSSGGNKSGWRSTRICACPFGKC